MTGHTKDQKGFSGIEGLLIAVVVLLLGFVGYYVYHAQKNTNASYDASQAASTSPTSTNKSSNTYLNIPELGIKLKLGAGVEDATYAKLAEQPTGMATDETVEYGVSTKAFEAFGPGCSPTTINVAFIESVASPTTMVSSGTVKAEASNTYTLTKVGDRYYGLGTPSLYSGSCENVSDTDKASAFKAELYKARAGFKATTIEKL